MSGLFRDELGEARRLDWLGAANVAVPISQKAMAFAAGLILLCITTTLALCSYQRHDHIRGVLVYSYPSIGIVAPSNGYLTKWFSSVGSHVSEGQVIASISDPGPDNSKDAYVSVPQEGTLISSTLQPGDPVSRGQLVARVRTRGTHLVATFPLSAREVAYIAPGETLRLSFPAFPGQKFRPVVGATKAVVANTAQDAYVHPYLVAVTLPNKIVSTQGNETDLTEGLAVEALIPLQRQSLLGWILHPTSGDQ